MKAKQEKIDRFRGILKQNNRGFTLLEVLVVVIVVGMVVGFTAPKFDKTIRAARENTAKNQMEMIHAATILYYARNGEMPSFPDPLQPGFEKTAVLSEINSALGISIIAGDITYQYRKTGNNRFVLEAFHVIEGSDDFRLAMVQKASSASNPCCSSSTCLSVPNCPPPTGFQSAPGSGVSTY